MFIRFNGVSQPSHAFIALLVFLVQLFVSHPASIYLYNQFQGLRLSGLPLSRQHSYPTLSSALNIFSGGIFLLLLKTALFDLKQVLSNFYAISFLWRRYIFREKCRARYCDVAKTTCGIRLSNYLPLLLYRIPLNGLHGNWINIVFKKNHLYIPFFSLFWNHERHDQL